MHAGRWRGASGLPAVVVVALVGAWLLATVAVRPAHACSCGEPDFDQVVADASGEHALVLAQRTDLGGGGAGQLHVLQTLAGGPVVDEVDARFDDGASCYPGMPGGAVAALVLAREGGTWTTTMCGMAAVGQALAAVDEPAEAEARAGPPTLLFGGAFGGPRLAALDAAGRVGAWAGEDGRTVALATCPGGTTAVEVSSTDAAVHLHRWSLPDMTPAAEPVELGPGPTWDAAVRCLDPEGEQVVLVVPAHEEPGAIGVVTGQRVDMQGAMVQTVASAGGTTAVVVAPRDGDRFEAPTLARVDDDGELVELVTRSGTAFDRLSVSPSGDHVLAAGYPTEGPGDIVVVASADGSSVEMATIEGYHSIGWLSPERAWLRNEDTGAFGAVPSQVEAFTTDLAPAGTVDVTSAGSLVGLPDDALLRFGAGFPSVVRDGTTTSVREVRLVDATTAVPLDPAAVLTDVEDEAADAAEPASAPAAQPPSQPTSSRRGVTLPLVGGLVVLLGLAGTWALRARSRRS